MKVYLVLTDPFLGETLVCGVFSTEQLAQEFVKKQDDYSFVICEVTVDEIRTEDGWL